MTYTLHDNPNHPRATRSTGVHPICESQDVSRFKATDPTYWGEADAAPAWSRTFWAAVVIIAIMAVALGFLAAL